MGAVLSYVFGFLGGKSQSPADLGPESDIPDPASGLTPRQIAYVQTTWDLVRTDLKTHGVNFFILLFKTEPIIQTRFKGFANKSLEDLKGNKRLQAHGTTVFTALDSYVTNLNDISTVIEMLKTTGENHKNRKIPKTDFEMLSPVLIIYLKENLSPIWTPDTEKAWTKLMEVVLSVIFSAYD